MPERTYENLEAHYDVVRSDHSFEPHSHAADQLAWIPGGARIGVGDSRWHLHGDHFAWIPALAEHDMLMVGATEMFSLYIDQSLRPRQDRWERPLILPADDVAIAIVRSLCTTDMEAPRLRASMSLLGEILTETGESYDALALPTEPRARRVAEDLLANPHDDREIAEWALELGVSTKTLHRAFQADTGLTFGRWRTRARVYAAERLLAEGRTVQETAELVGFATSTGFIKAFRHVFGSTPATYVRAKRLLRSSGTRRATY